jgi:hypothetical protein
MFEYVATYAKVAGDPPTRAEQWLKYDYVHRLKLDNDFRELGEAFFETDEERERVQDFLPGVAAMPDLVSRTWAADEAWTNRFQELDEFLPEDFRRLRRLYPVIYRNGSRFTHPSSHVVTAFIAGNAPQLTVDDERPLQRDLAVIGSGVLVLGLAIAVTATPGLRLTINDIQQALAA